MPLWITCALLAAFVLVPAALAFVGDEEPDNAIHHESGDGQPGEDQDDPGLLMAA